MTLHTGERWAQEAGDEPQTKWCPECAEYVTPEYDWDEDDHYSEWCPFCDCTDLAENEDAGWNGCIHCGEHVAPSEAAGSFEGASSDGTPIFGVLCPDCYALHSEEYNVKKD